MSQNELLIERLRAAQHAIAVALQSLEAQTGAVEIVGTCPVCGEPIYAGEKPAPRRGVHARCSLKIKKEIDQGRISEDELIKKGILQPAKSGGRPKKATRLDELVAEPPENF